MDNKPDRVDWDESTSRVTLVKLESWDGDIYEMPVDGFEIGQVMDE